MMPDLPTSELLARIGLNQLPPRTVTGLQEITSAFHLAVPFENLDVLAERPPSTDVGEISRKIALQKRGGWCYELNQLLAELLRRAGFEVKYRLARVCYRRPSPGPMTHLVLDVELDAQRWLIDVGFGGPGPAEPIPWVDGESTNSKGVRFNLSNQSDILQLQRWFDSNWTTLYHIMPFTVQAIDLEMGSHFLSTWPNSPFCKQLLCIAYDGNSHWCLESNELLQRDAHWQIIERTPLADAEHLQLVLDEHFHIQISMTLAQTVWQNVHKHSTFNR